VNGRRMNLAVCMRSALSRTSNIFAVSTANVEQKRFRYYWRKRPQNKQRVLLMQVAMPRLSSKKTQQSQPSTTENKLFGIDLILEREVREIFKSNPMVIACLYTEPAIPDQYFQTRYELQQKELNMTRIPSHVISHVLTGSKYENMNILCQSQTALIFGNPDNLQHVFEITKKNKYLCVLGGLYHDKMVTLEQLKRYGSLPEKKQLQSELVGMLSSQLSSTYHLLQNPINSLAYTMKERQKMLTEEEE